MIKKDLIEKDGFFILNCCYAEFYISRKYLEKDIAKEVGSSFKTLGLFYARTFSSMEKPDPFEIMNIPVPIILFPTEKETRKMTIEGVEDDYLVLKFFKGDKIMNSSIQSVATDTEDFLNYMLAGVIPRNIPYDKILHAFLKNIDLSKVGIKLPIIVYEIIISEIYRYKGDPALKYGQYLSTNFDPKKLQIDYILANIRSICKSNSTFAGVSFENIDEMITSGINNNKYNRKETKSPVEDVLKF